MVSMKRVIAALVLCALAGAANADGATGQVTRIYPSGTTVNFWLSGSCKTSSSYAYWQFSIASDIGKAWYAMLLSSAATRTPVKIAHPGACDPTQHQAVSYIYQDF